MNRSHCNKRGTLWWLLAVWTMAMVLLSCSSQSNSAIVGKWQEKGDPSVTEFRADGTFSIHAGEMMNGKYKSVDKEHIKLTFDGAVGKVVGDSTWKAVVQADTLELTDPDGNKSQFQRVKME